MGTSAAGARVSATMIAPEVFLDAAVRPSPPSDLKADYPSRQRPPFLRLAHVSAPDRVITPDQAIRPVPLAAPDREIRVIDGVRHREPVRSRAAPVGLRYRIGDQVRRGLDIVGASAAIVLLAPLLVLVAAVLKGLDDGPVLFSQDRIGRDGRRFRCFKFRSMVQDAEGRLASVLAADPALRGEWLQNRKLKRDPRVTQFGDFLRRSSLDELPQLFNILRGDMTFIGPRPIVEDEAVQYGRWFRYYLAVKPGLTGLWQVSGRNDVTYRRRVAMDRLFCQSYSFELCLLILFGTGPAVLMRRGSY